LSLSVRVILELNDEVLALFLSLPVDLKHLRCAKAEQSTLDAAEERQGKEHMRK
jgi:hypothetical protein